MWQGGCDCGAVRYQAAEPPVRMFNCHCRDCQRLSGAAYAAIAAFTAATLRFEGELRWHEKIGSSGHRIARGFCPACGSPVAIRPGRNPGTIAVQAASLDDPAVFRPTADIYTASAQPWDTLAPDTRKFEGDFRRSAASA